MDYKYEVNGVSEVDYGVDWLTLTEVMEFGEGECDLMAVWVYIRDLIGQEHLNEMVNWAGYSGVRLQNTSIRFGSRQRGLSTDYILSSSGKVDTQTVIDACDRFEVIPNCTRIDLQITVMLDEQCPSLASKHYDNIMLSKERSKSVIGRRNCTLIKSDTGATLYIGSRKSRGVFYRVYDKSIDLLSVPGTYWRFEAECKRDVANHLFAKVMDHGDSCVPGIVIAQLVSDTGFRFNGLNYAKIFSALDRAKRSDDDKALDWIGHAVRPVVQRLIRAGLETDVMDALGVTWLRNVSRETISSLMITIGNEKFNPTNEDDQLSLARIYGKIAAIRVYNCKVSGFQLPDNPDRIQDQIESVVDARTLAEYIDIVLEENR